MIALMRLAEVLRQKLCKEIQLQESIYIETKDVKLYEVWLINDKVVPHFVKGVEGS